MKTLNLRLQWLDGEYTIYRFSPDTPLPALPEFGLVSANRTEDELSFLVRSDWEVPVQADHVETGYACFRIVGTLGFDQVGILAEISAALATGEIPLLAISTFDTDYFLVPGSMRDQASDCLHRYWV